MEFAVNAGISVLVLVIAYCVMCEGAWGAALMFFNVVFAGIIAFNFYEPLANLLATNVTFFEGFADTLCLMALFCVSVLLLRLTTETLAPGMVRFPAPVYHLGRIFFGLGTGLTLMAILLLAYETAPVHKKIFGVIDYKAEVPYGLALDRQWLGFFQHTTGQAFTRNTSPKRDPFGQYGNAQVFDPRSEWILVHQDARPYGEETVLSEDAAAAPAGGPAPAPAPAQPPH